MTEPNPFAPHPAPDNQPIRQGDNTREFFIKWHAVQLAKSFLAFLPTGAAPTADAVVDDATAAGLIDTATSFAVACKFTQAEHALFIETALRTLKEGL